MLVSFVIRCKFNTICLHQFISLYFMDLFTQYWKYKFLQVADFAHIIETLRKYLFIEISNIWEGTLYAFH